MKRLALTLLAAAALVAGCGRTPTAPVQRHAAAPVQDGYLGSGNRTDSTTTH